MHRSSLKTKHSQKEIWYISKYSIPPSTKGGGSRGFHLMKELVRLGHSVTIITSDSNHFINPPTIPKKFLIEKFESLTWVWVKTTKYVSVKSFKRILSWFHFEFGVLRLPLHSFPRPDVVIASSLSLTSIITGIILSKRFSCRLIFEVRDIWPLTLTEEGGYNPRSLFIKALAWVERIGYNRSDAIVGTMPNLELHVRSVSGSKTPVYCVPMGYDQNSINASKKLPAAYLNSKIPKNKFLLGYVGSIGRTNALETLFECAERLTQNENIHFVIVGSGDLLKGFQMRFGSMPNITFVGQIAKKDVQAVLSTFDALYLSSYPSKVWDYGQSLNKVIDYMISGKPIIASYSGYQSMINEAKSGVFVPAGDIDSLETEILKFSKTPKKDLEDMGIRGREWLLMNRSYETLARIYEDIIFPK